MPKIVDEEQQRLRIRRAARQVFADRGFVNTGLAHVARAAGMHRSNLYHYYEDKDALVADLAKELLDEEEALFANALDGDGTPLERIVDVVASVSVLFGEWGRTGRLILQLWAGEPSRVGQSVQRIRHSLAAVIRDGQQQGGMTTRLTPEAAATLIVGLMDGVLIQVFLDPEAFADRDALRRDMCESVHRLLTP